MSTANVTGAQRCSRQSDRRTNPHDDPVDEDDVGTLVPTVAVLVGYSAGASYAAAERWLGRGSGVLVGVVAVVGLTVWFVRRRRSTDPDVHPA